MRVAGSAQESLRAYERRQKYMRVARVAESALELPRATRVAERAGESLRVHENR